MLGVGGSIHYSRVESALNATKSVSLDGTNDFIDCSDAIANSVKLIGSVSIWVKMDTGASNDAIWAMGTDTSNDNKLIFFHSTSNDELRFLYRGDSTNTTVGYSIAEGTFISGGWAHCVATWDQTAPSLKIYFNGAQVAAGTASTTAYTTTANKIFLGKATNADNTYWAGHFSNYALYNKVLSASQVLSLYNNGKPGDLSEGQTNGLVQWLKLDEASGTFADSSGNSRTGAGQNSPTQGVTDAP